MRTDWIDAFLEYTENVVSPELFKKWAAISIIGGALERKVWVRTLGSNLYPNMYIVFVAPPGIGKTELTWRAREFFAALEEPYIASTSVTKASLIDELAAANRRIMTNDPKDPVLNFNSLLVCVNELGVLIPAYEDLFMNTLTDLWDCKPYSERRRTSKIEIDIKAPQLHMLTACTPSYLTGVLPDGAWDQGFLSRTILIHSAEQKITSLFADEKVDRELESRLHTELKTISNLYGKMEFTKEAAERIDHFFKTKGDPAPTHPKLINYNIRRTVHLLKLCMVMSVSRSDELIIRLDDFQRAFDYLTEAEANIPDIFKAMLKGGSGQIMRDTWHFLYEIYIKENKPIEENRLYRYLQEHVPSYNIQNTIEAMVKSHMIKKTLGTKGSAYIPQAEGGKSF